jgi:hypothetical protein
VIEESKYLQLVKAVFGNDKGRELLEAWERMYVERPSYVEGVDINEVLVREGERRFPSVIIEIMRTKS